nr:hypothetical protein [Acetomicrobium sp. S15 = DSM 107314]
MRVFVYQAVNAVQRGLKSQYEVLQWLKGLGLPTQPCRQRMMFSPRCLLANSGGDDLFSFFICQY